MAPLEVDADHSGERLGSVIHAELDINDRLRVVAVLDDDWLAQVDEPVYFSPTIEMRGNTGGSVHRP